MDWSKAKTILIISLLVTNLILLATLYFKNMKTTADDNDLLLEILAASNIQVDSEMPKKPANMAALYVKPEILSPSELEQSMNISLPYEYRASDPEDVESVKIFADELIEKSGLKDQNTYFAGIEKHGSSWVVNYIDVYNGIPIEESYIRLQINDGECSGIERKWYTPVSLHDRKGEIISPVKALMQLLSEKREDEILVITDIELVYWVDASNTDSLSLINDIAVPAWKIIDSTGRIRYIVGYQ